MPGQVTPDTISINGTIEYESAEEALEGLAKVRKLDAADHFSNQFMDLSGDDAFVTFNTDPPEEGVQDSLSITRNTEMTPIESDAENVLFVSANFEYSSLDIFKNAFDELFTDFLTEINSVEVKSMSFIFELDSNFDTLGTLQPFFEITDHEVTGIQFEQGRFAYIFQQVDDGTGVRVNSREEFPVTSGSFIAEQLEKATPFIEEITDDEQS